METVPECAPRLPDGFLTASRRLPHNFLLGSSTHCERLGYWLTTYCLSVWLWLVGIVSGSAVTEAYRRSVESAVRTQSWRGEPCRGVGLNTGDEVGVIAGCSWPSGGWIRDLSGDSIAEDVIAGSVCAP